jgi:hypothetical protein
VSTPVLPNAANNRTSACALAGAPVGWNTTCCLLFFFFNGKHPLLHFWQQAIDVDPGICQELAALLVNKLFYTLARGHADNGMAHLVTFIHSYTLETSNP